MKALQRPAVMPAVIFAAGLTGLLLRVMLYRVGYDDRGLMSNTHPLHLLCWALAAAVGICCCLTARKLKERDFYGVPMPAGRKLRAGLVLIPGWFLISALSVPELVSDNIGKAWLVLSFLAVAGVAYTGYCRFRGRKPNFLVCGMVCLFFAVDMICRYRIWSGNPQLPDYSFHLLACACLTLVAYQHTSLAVGLGSSRQLVLWSLLAVFFCILSLTGQGDPNFYIAGALWAAFNLTILLPAPEEPDITDA